MAGFNSLTIVGNCGRDAEMRYTQNGKAVTSFSVAVGSKSGGSDVVTWFEVQAWERLAELAAEYIVKGKQVLVQGTVSINTWETKEGEPRSTMRVQARTIQFLGSKADDAERTERPAPTEAEMPF